MKLKEVAFKNFLATGDVWTTIRLDVSPSTLITGKNGEGKSQFIDALFFGLFGRAFRKINKSALINSRNGKGLEVKVTLSEGADEYVIHRGMKPNIFNIHKNSNLVDQHAAARDYQQLLEDTVLKMNHKSASQVVVLGSATFVPFMQLSAGDRRAVIEDILDIKVFTLMNAALKEKVSKLKVDYTNNEAEIQRQLQTIKLLEQLSDNEKKGREADIKIREEEIEAKQKQIDELSEKNVESGKIVTALKRIVSKQPEVKQKIAEIEKFQFAINSKTKRISEEIWFFEENETCPTCLQEINEDHKAHVLETKEKKKQELEVGLEDLTNKLKDVYKDNQEIHDALVKSVNAQNDINIRANDIKMAINRQERLEKEIEDIKAKSNVVTDTETKLNDARKELKKFEELKSKYMYEAKVFEKTSSLLKDGGIKAQIIKQYLPVINKAINKYLRELGFQHSFELDEQFNETIKSHFIDEFSYENFSEGEKQRIDLALLLAWRYVAKLKGSINTNLLAMDETFDSSMDQEGVDSLMNLIQQNFSKDTNLFVISHRGDAMQDRFDRHLKFRKQKGYSILETEK
jgi:DNA repair exonuclease SbcCD ATPase subunit